MPAVNGDVESAGCGGEDYKLLFTVDGSAAEQFERDFQQRFGRLPYCVGTIISSSEPSIHWLKGGEEIAPSWRGFSHF